MGEGGNPSSGAARPATLSRRVRVPDHVLTRELEGELVLLNLDTEQYLGLDDVGTRVWHALGQGGSIADACGRLLDEFDVAPEQLHADVLALVERMREHGLVEIGDA